MWDATFFGLFNEDFPLYIKHEDLSEIAHSGQCLNISIIQLWILQVTLHYFYYLTYCFKLIHNLITKNNSIEKKEAYNENKITVLINASQDVSAKQGRCSVPAPLVEPR